MAKRARSQTKEDIVAMKALSLEAAESRDGTDMEGESVFVDQRQPIDLLTSEKMAPC